MKLQYRVYVYGRPSAPCGPLARRPPVSQPIHLPLPLRFSSSGHVCVMSLLTLHASLFLMFSRQAAWTEYHAVAPVE